MPLPEKSAARVGSIRDVLGGAEPDVSVFASFRRSPPRLRLNLEGPVIVTRMPGAGKSATADVGN
jgi:hypothetical protein